MSALSAPGHRLTFGMQTGVLNLDILARQAIHSLSKFSLFTALLFLFSPVLAQVSVSPSSSLWHSETVYPGSGFVIKERLQTPIFGITAGIIPGAIPIIVKLHMDGAVKSWTYENYYWRDIVFYPDGRPPDGEWMSRSGEKLRPLHATIHFGYSYQHSQTDYPKAVLEDGTVLESPTPLTHITDESFTLFDTYQLGTKPDNQIYISSSAAHAT